MATQCFWLRPTNTEESREIDPLGFSSLHEAAADVVLPHLTWRTLSADEYLWVLIGLGRAAEFATTDVGVWRFFARFERALKLSWYWSGRESSFNGIRAVMEQCDAGASTLDFRLLADQRSQGLLGAYLRPLRRSGLVSQRSLKLEPAGSEIAAHIGFYWSGEQNRTWCHQFNETADQLAGHAGQEAKQLLGRKLFSHPEMVVVANAIQRLGAKPQWGRAANMLRDRPDKATIARIAAPLGNLLQASTAAFWQLLQEPITSIQPLPVPSILLGNWIQAVPNRSGWADPFVEFRATAGKSGKAARAAIVRLHERIWSSRGHEDFWVIEDGRRLKVRPDIRYKRPAAGNGEWDFRWSVCHRLVRQTKWRATK
jgi:hypothetical protein